MWTYSWTPVTAHFNLLKTWSGQFHSYGDEDTWPVIRNRPKVIPDKTKINRGRRRGIRLSITMDEMECRNTKRRQLRKRNNVSTSEVPPTEEPLPMAALQLDRRISRTHPRGGTQNSMRNVPLGRLSFNVDSRSMNNPADIDIQPRRAFASVDPSRIRNTSAGIRAESARFSSRPTSIGEESGQGNKERREK